MQLAVGGGEEEEGKGGRTRRKEEEWKEGVTVQQYNDLHTHLRLPPSLSVHWQSEPSPKSSRVRAAPTWIASMSQMFAWVKPERGAPVLGVSSA